MPQTATTMALQRRRTMAPGVRMMANDKGRGSQASRLNEVGTPTGGLAGWRRAFRVLTTRVRAGCG